MIPFLDLKKQYHTIKPEIDAAINNVLEGGSFILGEQVRLFEKEFAAYCNAKFAVGVANGTEALQLSLLAAGIKQGGEVISVANTASATIAAIEAANAKPVLVDVDGDSFTMNPALLKKAISKKTKAIIPVHLFGQSCDMKPIMEIAQKHGLIVIEDACQAHGALYNGKKVGSLGTVGCFSFYPTKNLGCYGDSGMIVTNDAKIAENAALLRNYGWKERYSSDLKGFNSRLDEIQAAILRVKLKHLDTWNDERRKIAKKYSSELKSVIPPVEEGYTKHVYHLYVVKSSKRDSLQNFLKQNGIGTLIHYPVPIHKQKAYKNLRRGKLPVTEKLAKQILSLPLYPEMQENEVNEVIGKINSFK